MQANAGDPDQGCRGQGQPSSLCVSPVMLTAAGSQELLCINAPKWCTPQGNKS